MIAGACPSTAHMQSMTRLPPRGVGHVMCGWVTLKRDDVALPSVPFAFHGPRTPRPDPEPLVTTRCWRF